MLKLIVRCSYIGIPLISIGIIGYLASALASQRAINGNSAQSYIAGTIIIAVDITKQAVNAVCCTINQRCITIGALNTVQLNVHCFRVNGNAASSVIYKLIVAQLICIAGKLCIINFQAVSICTSIRSVAPVLIISILSVSFIAYACAILQAYLIAVDDAVILQAHIAICFQTFLATVGRAGVDVVQVNLLRIYFRVTCGYFDIVVLGEVCYILCNDTVFPCGPLVIAFVVGLVIVVYKTAIGNCTFFDAYSSFITVDKCVMILDTIACTISEASIAIGTYYIVQAYAQLCFAYIRITIAIYYQIVVLIQACICNFYSTAPGIVAMVIRYPVACYASNCAITINCYLKVTSIIVIAVYQTGDVACAVTATGNRCITVGAVYVTQANFQRRLFNRRLAIAFQFQLIVFIQSCIVCCQSTSPGVIIVSIVRYPVAAYASNCAVTINCYLKVTGIIVIAVYQAFDTACAVTATGNRCITIGAYNIVQAYLQGCLLNHGSTTINNQLVVLLKLIVRCNYISIPLISITSIIGYLAATYAINRAIAGNSAHSYIADTIIIAVDITSQSVNAICCTINQRFITIGTLNTVQLNMHFCLFNRNAACSFINQLIVAQLICIAGKRCIINLQAFIICASVRSITISLISRIAAAILHIYNSTISQLDIITINNSICQILNAYHAIYMVINSITAAVGQLSINIVQVNLARQNIRFAMNCRFFAAYTIILEFIISCKAVIQLNVCIPIVAALILSTLFRIDSNNTFILTVLDFILRISDNHLTVQLFLHSVIESVKSINAQRIVNAQFMVIFFLQIAIRSVNSITGNIQHLFGNLNITHGKVIAQVVGAYFATAGNLSGPQPAAVITGVLQNFALQQAVVVIISCKGIIYGINCRKLAAINPAEDIKMVCRIINPTFLQVAIYRNLSQEHLQQRVSAFIVKLPGCFLIIKSIAVQLLGIVTVLQCSISINDIAVSDSTMINIGIPICCIAINIAYLACIAAHNVCHIAIACYRSSAISVAQLAFSRITANDTADIASAADCTVISVSIIIKLSSSGISFACFSLGNCYYAVENLVQRTAISTGNATNIAALLCLDYACVIACRQRAAVSTKQTADVFSCKRCNGTVLCIIGACLNRTVVINLVLVIIVVGVAPTGDNTMVDTDNTTYICYTADITIYSVHQGGIADIRASAICLIAIYTDNTAGAVFLRAANRSIAMHLALICHDDVRNIRTVFTDDAASTTS